MWSWGSDRKWSTWWAQTQILKETDTEERTVNLTFHPPVSSWNIKTFTAVIIAQTHHVSGDGNRPSLLAPWTLVSCRSCHICFPEPSSPRRRTRAAETHTQRTTLKPPPAPTGGLMIYCCLSLNENERTRLSLDPALSAAAFPSNRKWVDAFHTHTHVSCVTHQFILVLTGEGNQQR